MIKRQGAHVQRVGCVCRKGNRLSDESRQCRRYRWEALWTVGINKDGLLLRYKENDMESLLRTNLVGSMLLTRSVLPYMVKAKRGSIVSIGSIVGERGRAGQSVYAATKSALVFSLVGQGNGEV